jgi:prophage regulatory protein
MKEQKYADVAALAARYGVDKATIWRWTAAGRFPKPVRLSPGCTRWRFDEVEAFERERASAAA